MRECSRGVRSRVEFNCRATASVIRSWLHRLDCQAGVYSPKTAHRSQYPHPHPKRFANRRCNLAQGAKLHSQSLVRSRPGFSLLARRSHSYPRAWYPRLAQNLSFPTVRTFLSLRPDRPLHFPPTFTLNTKAQLPLTPFAYPVHLPHIAPRSSALSKCRPSSRSAPTTPTFSLTCV